MAKKKSSMDELFTSEGELKRRPEISPFFLRPAYQYTSAEVKDTDQKDLHSDD